MRIFDVPKNIDHRMKLFPCIFLIFFLNIEKLFSNIANMHIVFLQEYHHCLNIVSTNTKPFFPLKMQWILVPLPMYISVSGNT